MTKNANSLMQRNHFGLKSIKSNSVNKHPIFISGSYSRIIDKKCLKCGNLKVRIILWDGYKNVLMSKNEIKRFNKAIKIKNKFKKFISSPKFIPLRRFFNYQPIIGIPLKIKGKYYKTVPTGGTRFICTKCQYIFDK